MHPLRCGAGEAGAFHPLYEAVQTIRAKTVCASVFLVFGVRRRSGFPKAGFAVAERPHDAENIRKSGG